jgi:nucleotide-binding universal stress UspA family protein
LLVVGAIGRRAATMWRLGSVADRLSQSAPVPLLVVREPRAFVRWCEEQQPLGVVLALGPGRPTRAAVRQVQGLVKLGECRLSEVHVYDPEAEARRMGLGEPETLEARDKIESALARELPGRELTTGAGRFVALAARGSVQEALAEFVDAEKADLLVVGSHHKGALHRRFRGSVSYGVLAAVEGNVLVVPAEEHEHVAPKIRPVRRALVATDLSATGNAAVEFALGMLPDGGTLVLLHIDVPPELPSGFIMGYHPTAHPTMGERAMRRALVEGELDKLAAVGSRALEVKIEVLEASDIPRAILEAAERHSADLVCLGTHHHGRVASTLIGSVARTVARRSSRPVLLVPA